MAGLRAPARDRFVDQSGNGENNLIEVSRGKKGKKEGRGKPPFSPFSVDSKAPFDLRGEIWVQRGSKRYVRLGGANTRAESSIGDGRHTHGKETEKVLHKGKNFFSAAARCTREHVSAKPRKLPVISTPLFPREREREMRFLSLRWLSRRLLQSSLSPVFYEELARCCYCVCSVPPPSLHHLNA